MFLKNRKLEVRLVKDDKVTEDTATLKEPTPDYIGIAEEAAGRLGKKLITGVVVIIVTTAVVGVLASAATTALDNALTTE